MYSVVRILESDLSDYEAGNEHGHYYKLCRVLEQLQSGRIFLQKKTVHTIPLAIASFYREFGADWNLVAAAALIGVIPIIIVFLCLQKYYIKGLAAGALKG